MKRKAGAILPPESEESWQKTVEDTARVFGWEKYHTKFSFKSDPGFPDEVFCRPPRLLFCELKRDDEEPTLEQQKWLGLLGMVPGVEVYVWKPKDWPDVQRILR